MTAYATRTPLQTLTNVHYIMTEQPSDGRRTSARLKIKEDVFATNGPTILSKQNGVTKLARSSAKTAAATRSKRKLDYDEDDDGFKFSRSKTKRAKAVAPVIQEEKIPTAVISDQSSYRQQKAYQPSQEFVENQIVNDEERPTPRRSTRQAGHEKLDRGDGLSPPKQRTLQRSPRAQQRNQQQQDESQISAEQRAPNEPTKIALPFADTPIIRRNKEMRKGNNESRRSSLGMRGRRASSLIDSGTSSALPHEQVETADFYKHIESTLLEPRRMRQLLMWCGSRALGEEPSLATEDRPTKLAARQIQQELLKDFSAKAELSDWFSRDDSPSKPKILKPNPRNLANLAKIEELESKLKTLRAEHEQWTHLQKNPLPETLQIPPLPSIESLPPANIPSKTTIPTLPPIQSISSSQTPISGATTAELSTTTIQTRLNSITTDFELNLDKLLDSINKLGQHLASAEKLSKKVLGDVARVLEEKEKSAVEKEGTVGTRDTLRALTRVIDQNLV